MSQAWEDALRGSPLTVACDGSALSNPRGPGGWAWYVDDRCWAAGGAAAASNNVMELTALLQFLTATAHLPPRQTVHVVLDSTYVRDCVTSWLPSWERNGWKTRAGTPVKNQELIRPIATILRNRPGVSFRWVRGHSGNPLNEAADTRARAVSESIRAQSGWDGGPGWTR